MMKKITFKVSISGDDDTIDNGSNHLEISFDIESNKLKRPLSQLQEDSLVEIFALLHPFMEESFCDNDEPLPHLSPRELFNLAIKDIKYLTCHLAIYCRDLQCLHQSVWKWTSASSAS